jgi:hypothetical protein
MIRKALSLPAAALLCGALACSALTAGCATTRSDGLASTEVSIVDEKGDGLAGEIIVKSRLVDEKCVQEAQSCYLDVPAGFYLLRFVKMRAGHLGQAGGGSVGSEKASGCLRARVQFVPGKKIVCRKRAEFNCAGAAQETMDCGEASAARYGYQPKPEDLEEPK